MLAVYYAGAIGARTFPSEVRHRVWGQDPDAAVCGRRRPAPHGRRVRRAAVFVTEIDRERYARLLLRLDMEE